MPEETIDYSKTINALREEFDEKLNKIQKKINKEFIGLREYYDNILCSLQSQMILNKLSLNKNIELEERLNTIKDHIKMFDDKLKENKEDEELNEMESFKRNLNIASKIVESWTPEQKIHNSIGYPKP